MYSHESLQNVQFIKYPKLSKLKSFINNFICSNYTPIMLLSQPKSNFKISKQNLSIPFLRLGKQQKPETVWKVVFNNIKMKRKCCNVQIKIKL